MNLLLNLETAQIVNGLLKVEFDKIETEQAYWKGQLDFEHIAPALDSRLNQVELLQLELQTMIDYERARLSSSDSGDGSKSSISPTHGEGFQALPNSKDSNRGNDSESEDSFNT